jgi:hypothetical protein
MTVMIGLDLPKAIRKMGLKEEFFPLLKAEPDIKSWILLLIVKHRVQAKIYTFFKTWYVPNLFAKGAPHSQSWRGAFGEIRKNRNRILYF